METILVCTGYIDTVLVFKDFYHLGTLGYFLSPAHLARFYMGSVRQ